MSSSHSLDDLPNVDVPPGVAEAPAPASMPASAQHGAAPATAAPAGMTWRRTRALIRSDLDRLAAHLQAESTTHRLYFSLLPGFQALLWHRVGRYLYLNGWVRSARLLFLLSIYVTRAEIPPTTSLGEAALINHATAVNLFGTIGARLTVNGNAGFGGGFGTADIGGGPGYPLVGDDVVMAYGAQVMGPVRIGSGAHIGPGALVTTDVPPGALVLWAKARIIRGGATSARPGAQP